MWQRLAALVRRLRPVHLAEQDLDDEVRFHIESRAEAMVHAGVSPAEALRRARLEFGASERVKEQCRDARPGAFAREIAADIRSAWRQTRRDRGLSVTILATITLAIGVTATVFAVVNAVVLDPLPYRDHARLVMLWETNARTGVGLEQARKTRSSVTAADFVQWRDQSGLFEGLAAIALMPAAHLGGATRLTFLDAGPNGEPAQVALVSPAFFDVTGIRPRLGRPFTSIARHDRQPRAEQAEPAVLLQDAYWRSRFQGREDVIGRTVWQDYGGGPEWSRQLLVAGVMPREFAVVSRSIDYLQPFDIDFQAAQYPESRDFAVIGRLKSGVSLAEAQQRADAFSRVLERRNVGRVPGWQVRLVPAAEDAAGEFQPFMLALLVAVLVLVLVLAVNTSTLLLLKAVARAKEIAVRSAMGASPGRLIRQLVTESTLLSVAGAASGLAVAHVLLGWLRLHLPNPKTWGGSFLEAESLRIDGTVALFALGAAVLVGGAFGLLPAWHMSRTDLVDSLKDSGPSVTSGERRRRVASGLIAAQLVLAAILATGSGLLLRSAVALYSQGPGFEHASRIVIGMRGQDTSLLRIMQAAGRTRAESQQELSSSGEAYWAAREQLRRAMLDRAARLPGVLGVTSATAPIMSGGYWLARFQPESARQGDAEEGTEGLFTSVDANYFAELRIPLLEGRTFSADDRGGSPRVAVVSAEFARRLWPGRSALGRRFQSVRHPEKPWFTVIGVVGDTRADGMDKPPVAQVYEPWTQNRWWYGSTFVVLRSSGDPLALVPALRQALAGLDKDTDVSRLHRVSDLVNDSAWRLNYAAQLSAGLAAVSLLLGAIGIYGVLSHAVRERTREIGLRVALGARSKHLAGFVLRHVVVAVGVGVVAGLAVASSLMNSLRALLFGVEPFDPATFAAVALVLAGVALIAAAMPLRRALKLEPLVALRHE
jgi:putative ABC transport system permease protein